MDEPALRELLHDVLAGLDLPVAWDAGDLCAALGAARGRPIVLAPRDDLPVRGGFGALVRYPDRDLIVLQQRSTAPGRAWIVFHELTHLIRDHAAGGDPALWCGGGAEDGTGTLYDRWQEWEAETGAAILSEWASRPARPALPDPGCAVEQAVLRGFGGGPE